jgi:hypothetical protein
MHVELERLWKEVSVACFKITSYHLRAETVEVTSFRIASVRPSWNYGFWFSPRFCDHKPTDHVYANNRTL